MAQRCPHCGTAMRWLMTPTGKLVRLEADPLPRGALGGWVIEGMMARPFAPTTDDPDMPRYAEHLARCPGARLVTT